MSDSSSSSSSTSSSTSSKPPDQDSSSSILSPPETPTTVPSSSSDEFATITASSSSSSSATSSSAPTSPTSAVGDKAWDLDMKKIPSGLQSGLLGMGQLVDRLEEAFFFQGTNEAKELAQEMLTTGFLLPYKVLIEEKKLGSLESEAKLNTAMDSYEKAKKKIRDAKSLHPHWNAIPEDSLIALSLYTTNAYFKVLNAILRDTKGKEKEVLKYGIFAASFVKGFRMLPSFWGTVYRGAAFSIEDYKVGDVAIWQGFTSCSKSRTAAEEWMKKRCRPTPTDPLLLIIIHRSKSGRSLEDVSVYPKEQEVVFRPFTSFKVLAKRKTEAYWELELEEGYQDARGRKLLIWVDDKHTERDSKEIADQCEKNGVTPVFLKSTNEFFDFLKRNEKVLERNINRLRIITDMHRFEDGKEVIDAGYRLVQRLVEEKKYPERMLIYCGKQYHKQNQDKVHALYPHVDVTYLKKDCLQFASFQDVYEPKILSPQTPDLTSHLVAALTSTITTTTTTTTTTSTSTTVYGGGGGGS